MALFEKLIERGLKREVAAGYIESIPGHKSVEQLNQVVGSSIENDGERQIQTFFVTGKSRLKIEFEKNGTLKCGVPELGPVQMNQWDDVHILNVENLRRKVDAAVKEMG